MSLFIISTNIASFVNYFFQHFLNSNLTLIIRQCGVKNKWMEALGN